jgi:hypothetical protein
LGLTRKAKLASRKTALPVDSRTLILPVIFKVKNFPVILKVFLTVILKVMIGMMEEQTTDQPFTIIWIQNFRRRVWLPFAITRKDFSIFSTLFVWGP